MAHGTADSAETFTRSSARDPAVLFDRLSDRIGQSAAHGRLEILESVSCQFLDRGSDGLFPAPYLARSSIVTSFLAVLSY